MRPSRALLSALVAAVAIAGCGGEDEESATVGWANDLCSATSSWRDSLQSTADSIGEASTAEDIEGAVDDASDATNDFVDDLQSLGAPETESGEQARSLVTTLAADVRSEMEKVEEALDSAEGIAGAAAAASAVAASLATVRQQVSTTLDALENLDAGGELSAAFDEAESCDELRSSE